MINTVESISKEDRKAFKDGIEAIKGYNVIFRGTNALISYRGDYIVTNEALQAKGQAVKAMRQFIADFRVKQFNGVAL